MAVECNACGRALPEEPGTDVTSSGGRRFAVAHVNERGKLCAIGASDLSCDVVDLVSKKIKDGTWIDMLELGSDLAVVEGPHQSLPGHENCRWTGGRWYPCDTRAPDWGDVENDRS